MLSGVERNSSSYAPFFLDTLPSLRWDVFTPDYPFNYDDNADDWWHFNTEAGEGIVAEVVNFTV